VSQPIKNLKEVVPFAKVSDVEAAMLQKHGPDVVYGPGTFGVEFELTPDQGPDESEIADAISNSDTDTLLSYIKRRGDSRSFEDDYYEWLEEKRTEDQRYSRRGWNDDHGPIDLDTWLGDHEEPKPGDFETNEEYDDALSKWTDEKDDVSWTHDRWARTDMSDHQEEFVGHLQNQGEIERYVHDVNDLYNALSYDSVTDSDTAAPIIIEVIEEWLKQNAQRTNPHEAGTKTEWGVGMDGENVEIRTRHLTQNDFGLVEKFMDFLSSQGYEVSGNTSAHVHVGLPDDFDYYDLIAMVTLVDESAVKIDAGKDRNLEKWAALRDVLFSSILQYFFKKFGTPPGQNMPQIGKSIDLDEDQLRKFVQLIASKFMGTNIQSFFERGTVEYRYLASTMVERPDVFLKWVKYFMILPAVAQKRNRVVYRTDGGWTMEVYRRPGNGAQFVFKGGKGQMTGEPASASKSIGVSRDRKPATAPEITYDEKEKTIRRYLRKLEGLAKQKGGVNALTDKEYATLSKLQKAWAEIAKKHGDAYVPYKEGDMQGLSGDL
jgi:hypothetical protein